MKFREATLDDVSALRQLEQGVVEAERPFNDSIKPEGVIYYDLEGLIDSDNVCLLLAELDGEIAACGYVRIDESRPVFTHTRHGYLGFMYVSPAQRGQGLNGEIMERLIAWSGERSVTDFYLDVYSENAGAIRAYEKLGFVTHKVEMKLHRP
ncbi:acetyltransferase [Halioglobus sp. HI00S01]|uniref:GNAT family N-acetyltransferase n=1 Tax=Halioglobus sp. HI00S01 TaxID=1822214 RepID=UPI0007C3C123|nr:GNAT family N-acetyltransferase [Halioglobus sp. HI00S01]KZX57052.1 acetyltransferase [Halioglobus sp. HI00S01]